MKSRRAGNVDPDDAARHVVDGEPNIGHLTDARDERSEGADDRDESRKEDRLATVSPEEPLGPQQVLLIQQARGLAREDLRPEAVAGAVVDRVAEDRSNRQQDRYEGQVDRRVGPGREGTYGEEQRVTGQERGDDEGGLAEDDEEEQAVEPGPRSPASILRCRSRWRKTSKALRARFIAAYRALATAWESPAFC